MMIIHVMEFNMTVIHPLAHCLQIVGSEDSNQVSLYTRKFLAYFFHTPILLKASSVQIAEATVYFVANALGELPKYASHLTNVTDAMRGSIINTLIDFFAMSKKTTGIEQIDSLVLQRRKRKRGGRTPLPSTSSPFPPS